MGWAGWVRGYTSIHRNLRIKINSRHAFLELGEHILHRGKIPCSQMASGIEDKVFIDEKVRYKICTRAWRENINRLSKGV